MTWQAVLETIWNALNSPIGITAVAAIVAWALGRLFAARPAWAKYQGAIISAVRYAEKEIPDDAPNRALRRFDAALRYVLKVIEEVENRRPTAQEIASVREGIRIVHNGLDVKGVLSRRTQ